MEKGKKKEKMKKETLKLETNKWESFNLSSIFKITQINNKHSSYAFKKGQTPLVSDIKTNNGVKRYVENTNENIKPISGNCITINISGRAFYQPKNFYVESHKKINVLRPLDSVTFNPYIGLFITTVVNKRFDFGHLCKNETMLNVLDNATIKLPIQYNDNGTPYIDPDKKYSKNGYVPNWEFMEKYIKTIPGAEKI